MRLSVHPDAAAVAAELARLVALSAVRAVRARGRALLALAGGSTPLEAYARLGSAATDPPMPWSRTELLWGDERCVPEGDARSNAAAALAALGRPAGLAPDRVHRIRGELGPERAAELYEAELRGLLGDEPFPALDLVVLGLGPDGHTASLFPGSPALDEHRRPVVGVEAPAHLEPPVARVTMTLPLLAAARQVVFAVTGEAKAGVVGRMLGGGGEPDLPAARVRPAGRLVWLLDRAAATALG